MMEDNNCPKPTCGKPESTTRTHAGKRLSICGNGHSWDAAEIAAQRDKARDAETKEFEFKAKPNTLSPDELQRELDRLGRPGWPN